MNSVYLIESSTLTGIASAIRSKTGTSSAFTPAQMITEIENIPSGGGGASDVPPYKYQSSTITSYTGNETYVLENAFNSCSSLTTVSFPECVYIGISAFASCYSLTTASFPKCSYIGSSAFSYCVALTSALFPECSYIGTSGFYSCRKLTTALFPECSYIDSAAFMYCSVLSSISFPECSYIGRNVFYCCTSLTTASFPKCSYIGYGAFYSCTVLISLYLNGVSSIPSLENSGIFNNTPLSAGGSGTIYVPSSLYNSFLTAYNWSTLSARFVSV